MSSVENGSSASDDGQTDQHAYLKIRCADTSLCLRSCVTFDLLIGSHSEFLPINVECLNLFKSIITS